MKHLSLVFIHLLSLSAYMNSMSLDAVKEILDGGRYAIITSEQQYTIIQFTPLLPAGSSHQHIRHKTQHLFTLLGGYYSDLERCGDAQAVSDLKNYQLCLKEFEDFKSNELRFSNKANFYCMLKTRLEIEQNKLNEFHAKASTDQSAPDGSFVNRCAKSYLPNVLVLHYCTKKLEEMDKEK